MVRAHDWRWNSTWSISQRRTGQENFICLQSTALSAVETFGGSAAVGERTVALVLHKWFRRQQGGLEEENKFITLPCLHITPWRPVNEDSGEMSLILSSEKLLGGASGWTCHLRFVPRRPLTLQLSLYTTSFPTVCITLVLGPELVSCSLPNSVSRFPCPCLCRLQGRCDGKWLQTSAL